MSSPSSEIFIYANYELNSGLSFELNYNSVPSGILGTSLTQKGFIIPLINSIDNLEIGKIEFINNVQFVSTYPAQYNIIEYITIRLNNNSSIFATNYFSANENNYTTGDKIIMEIVSCTGDYIGNKGYIVIDVYENRRDVTIRIDSQ